MKNFKNLVIIAIIMALPLQVFASSISSSASPAQEQSEKKNYSSSFYPDEEGSLLFKIRVLYGITKAKPSGLPDMYNAGNKAPGKLSDGGYGADVAMTIFASDNFAAEVALGFIYHKAKSSTLEAMVNAYGTNAPGYERKKNLFYMIPASLAVQYHVAPFGGIRPYVGAGYSGVFMHTHSSVFRLNNAHGPLIQAGIDFICKDDTLFTLDVRKYFFYSKITFKGSFLSRSLNARDLSAKMDWDPLVISLGFGFKF